MPDIILSRKRQLIDLNGDKTVFDLEVKVNCKEPTEQFEAVIITQTDLDSGNINYRTFKGGMQARLKNEKNVYQNHFLCVKATKDIPASIDIIGYPDPQPVTQPNFQEHFPPQPPLPPPMIQKKKQESIFNFKTLMIILAVVGIALGLYFLWNQSGGEDKTSSVTVGTTAKPPIASILPTDAISKTSSTVTGRTSGGKCQRNVTFFTRKIKYNCCIRIKIRCEILLNSLN